MNKINALLEDTLTREYHLIRFPCFLSFWFSQGLALDLTACIRFILLPHMTLKVMIMLWRNIFTRIFFLLTLGQSSLWVLNATSFLLVLSCYLILLRFDVYCFPFIGMANIRDLWSHDWVSGWNASKFRLCVSMWSTAPS